MAKITVKNISSATVSLFDPMNRLNRELIPGRVINLTRDMYEDLSVDPGFNALVRGHYLKVDGVVEEEQVELVGTVYSAADINKMLTEKDITAFAKFIPTATMAEKDTVVNLIVDKGITDSAFVGLVQKYCGVDVIKAINIKHETEAK